MYDRKWIAHKNQWPPAQWSDQEKAPRHFPKPNLHQTKKGHGQFLVVCCPSDSLQLSESQQNHYNLKVRSANWWDVPKLQHLQPALANRRGPILQHNTTQLHDTQPILQSWINWGMKFCLICHIHLTSHQTTIMASSILTTFTRENAFPTRSSQKMLSKSLSNPRTWTFVLQE